MGKKKSRPNYYDWSVSRNAKTRGDTGRARKRMRPPLLYSNRVTVVGPHCLHVSVTDSPGTSAPVIVHKAVKAFRLPCFNCLTTVVHM